MMFIPDDKPMKTPEEVRAELNAAREAFKTRRAMYLYWGVTGMPSSMRDWNLSESADDDTLWNALVDDYIRDYEYMLSKDAALRADVRQWRERYSR